MTNLLGMDKVLAPGRGEFISVKHSQFDAVLHDYNPYFTCIWVPQENRENDLKQFSYAIVSSEPGRPPHVIRWLREEDLNNPAAILAWIWEGDVSKHRAVDILDRLDAEEKFKKAVKMRAEADEKEAAIDLVTNLATGGKHGKHFYRHNDKTFRR